MTRHKQRECIFKILFKIEFINNEELNEQIDFTMEDMPDISEEEKAYITTKVLAIADKLEEIDKIIVDNTEGWTISRIGKAELAILRLAIYEIKYDEDIPAGVAINEAVEIAKTYCEEKANKFVNGILAKIVK